MDNAAAPELLEIRAAPRRIGRASSARPQRTDFPIFSSAEAIGSASFFSLRNVVCELSSTPTAVTSLGSRDARSGFAMRCGHSSDVSCGHRATRFVARSHRKCKTLQKEEAREELHCLESAGARFDARRCSVRPRVDP
ncbi:MAG: hypothetical protein M5U08_21545 [Burkholderiales bacterium]|nr:hypothetical protein [Burkholderiales bacterium]